MNDWHWPTGKDYEEESSGNKKSTTYLATLILNLAMHLENSAHSENAFKYCLAVYYWQRFRGEQRKRGEQKEIHWMWFCSRPTNWSGDYLLAMTIPQPRKTTTLFHRQQRNGFNSLGGWLLFWVISSNPQQSDADRDRGGRMAKCEWG